MATPSIQAHQKSLLLRKPAIKLSDFSLLIHNDFAGRLLSPIWDGQFSVGGNTKKKYTDRLS
jgi:hypothetical protein